MFSHFSLLIVLVLLLPAISTAQSIYPHQPLRLVVTFASGGTADLLGRVVGQALSTRLAQPVVIDNKAGAGGALGAERALRILRG